MHRKTIVDHQSQRGPRAKEVRGSLIASSLQALRDFGHYERYLTLLPPQYHQEVLFCATSKWLPVGTAMQHYNACEALALSSAELESIGQAVSERVMGTLLGTILRTARTTGAPVTPWIPLRQYGRLCDRVTNGGSHRVEEMAEKDAIIESSGVPMLRYRYYRVAMLGIVRGAAGVFCKTCYAKELAGPPPETIRILLRWV